MVAPPHLRVAIISQCCILDSTTQTLHFPKLKKLTLEVTISEESLHGMFALCPALENLLLSRRSGFRCVRINSLTLRSIAISSGELITDDAPSLERLLQLDLLSGLDITVISAPKLEILGCLSYCPRSSRIVFGTTVLELDNGGPQCQDLINLMETLSLDMVIDFLKLFPCLEKLYIQSFIRSHPIRLKTIVFTHYRGIKSHVYFAMFFVLNAPMLELMRFEVSRYHCSESFIAQQHALLQLDNRASRDAQFYFTNSICPHDLESIRHTRDLSIADPFECLNVDVEAINNADAFSSDTIAFA
uniref:F-box/LRR-repeat protein 15/At3g58940/PEG3-like LRR domain-containing protein n=1 Tax=Leersia perrieri TaxID=77586 RepID=A0A0D9WXM3_9ORYZ